MPRLVFCYGSTWETRNTSFTFIKEKNITPYGKGVSKGYHTLPKQIEKKIKAGKPMGEVQKRLIKSIEQMKKDIERSPADRIKWMTNFKEDYESYQYLSYYSIEKNRQISS